MVKTSATTAASFDRTGYAVIPGFIKPHDLGSISEAVEWVFAEPPHPGMSRPGNDLFPLRWNDKIVARILRSDRHLRLLASALAASDLKWLSGYVSTKQANTPPLWWHQDWWCWDHAISFRRPATQVAVLCYLSDTDAGNGALRVIPGSHHASSSIHALLPEPHGDHANALDHSHPAMADDPGQATLALRAGDAVVIDYRLLHGTHANETSLRRDCILLSFIPEWNTLPSELKAHLISHPALPNHSEREPLLASSYARMLPVFDGPSASLAVNRIPPPNFKIQS